MHKVASGLNKAKREPFFDAVVADRDHRDCPTGDRLHKDIFGWLSPPDPWKNHHAACKLRHRRTAEWFIQGNTFAEWRMSEVPGSLLWVHGKRLLLRNFCGLTDTYFYLQRAPEKASFGTLIFIFPSQENLSCSSAPQSSKISVRCREPDLRR
jgi:hypothetical protein